jgi:hypothetical protein
MRHLIAAALLCLLAINPAQAARHPNGQQFCRVYTTDAGATAFRCFTRSEARNSARSFRGRHRVAHARQHHRRAVARIRDRGQIVAHPTGCPRVAFCGCGVASHIFGSPIRALWLAAAWLRYPSAAPAPGMVAVRQHHVFAIVALRSPGVVLAFDPNSGGHRTRIHLRSLAGYKVVNPRAG